MTNWKNKIVIVKPLKDFDDKKITFKELKDKVADILVESKLFEDIEYDSIALLREADDEQEFDERLGEIYDYADDNLIWIETMFEVKQEVSK